MEGRTGMRYSRIGKEEEGNIARRGRGWEWEEEKKEAKDRKERETMEGEGNYGRCEGEMKMFDKTLEIALERLIDYRLHL